MALENMKKILCPVCNKTLLMAKDGTIEIKCSKNTSRKGCGTIIRFEITDESVKHTIIDRE